MRATKIASEGAGRTTTGAGAILVQNHPRSNPGKKIANMDARKSLIKEVKGSTASGVEATTMSASVLLVRRKRKIGQWRSGSTTTRPAMASEFGRPARNPIRARLRIPGENLGQETLGTLPGMLSGNWRILLVQGRPRGRNRKWRIPRG